MKWPSWKHFPQHCELFFNAQNVFPHFPATVLVCLCCGSNRCICVHRREDVLQQTKQPHHKFSGWTVVISFAVHFLVNSPICFANSVVFVIVCSPSKEIRSGQVSLSFSSGTARKPGCHKKSSARTYTMALSGQRCFLLTSVHSVCRAHTWECCLYRNTAGSHLKASIVCFWFFLFHSWSLTLGVV